MSESGFRFFGVDYSVWLSRKLPDGAKIVDGGGFSQDASGHWYINLPVEFSVDATQSNAPAVGIDLGLKDLAVLSTGEKITAPRIFRAAEKKLAFAQRAKNKRRVQRIHRKIFNQRRDFLHKTSINLIRRYGTIVVGNINASGLAKTRMAKSVLDASWTTLRDQLRYKAITHGVRYLEVGEAYTSQTCSACGCLPESRPRGIAGLDKRKWICSDCGTFHDRDINSAINILKRGCGHAAPVGEFRL